MLDPTVPVVASAPAAVVGTAAGDSRTLSTFLITDIEGSTRLWEEQAAAMAGALALHDALLRSAVERRGGAVVKTTGDGLLAVFADAVDAVSAALDGQRAIRDADWGEFVGLRV